jgi:hypothetical protein
MTTARDKIVDIIDELVTVSGSGHTFGVYGAADAILAALPDMIAPLVWEGFKSGPYKIQVYDRGADLWFCGKAIDFDGEHERLLGDHLTMLSVDELKQHANAHHRAKIMAAFQTPTTGEKP